MLSAVYDIWPPIIVAVSLERASKPDCFVHSLSHPLALPALVSAFLQSVNLAVSRRRRATRLDVEGGAVRASVCSNWVGGSLECWSLVVAGLRCVHREPDPKGHATATRLSNDGTKCTMTHYVLLQWQRTE